MLLLVFLFGEKQVAAQSAGANVFVGNIVRHRDFLSFKQPTFTSGFEFEYIAKKDSSSTWQNFWRLPDLTHHLHFHNLGNPEELGLAIAYYPSVSIRMLGRRRLAAYCEMGNGLSYLTKKNELSNRANNAIGSHFNSIIVLGFELRYTGSNNLSFNLGPQIYHYSNGSAKAPNAGLNTVHLSFGLKYLLNEGPEHIKGSRYVSDNKYDKWNFEFNVGLGFRQINIPDGLNYRIPQVALYAHYHLFEFFRLVGGVSYQYNYADYYFMITQFESNQVAAREARDISIQGSSDFLFGDFFARFQLGIPMPFEEKINKDPFSIMFSLNYAKKINPRSDKKVFLGIGVRSHKFVAQYLSINTGVIL